MAIPAFSIARLPRIEFGDGAFARLPALIADYGKRVLLVTGNRSLQETLHWQQLVDSLKHKGLYWVQYIVAEEPSPGLVDTAVTRYKGEHLDVVVGVGGGSVLDAAKAIAGLLPHGNSVMDHLEGAGPEKPYLGPPLPYIAVPTTAGTGSEATKNAVLSRRGPDGFKKSFRDEQLVPDIALLDPQLLASCPPALIAANGMDALTQLMESYTSLRANPFTDALALSGLESARQGLLPWYRNAGGNATARQHMAYAALLSGITLAQCGLGSVHGLASPLGAFFPVPHGVVCGTLVASCTAANIRAMAEREADNAALGKYADLGRLLCAREYTDDNEARTALVTLLRDWTLTMALPRLGEYGMKEKDIAPVVANCRGSSMKTNPIVLGDNEIADILRERL